MAAVEHLAEDSAGREQVRLSHDVFQLARAHAAAGSDGDAEFCLATAREYAVAGGLQGNFPRSSSKLYEKALLVQTSLADLDLGLEPLIVVSEDDPANTPVCLANQLEPELTALGRLLDTQSVENRESADVRSRRRQVIRTFDHNIRAIIRMTQGMLRLAGRDDLARRFRPTLRRIVRRLRPAQADAGAEAASAAPDSGEGATAIETVETVAETSAS